MELRNFLGNSFTLMSYPGATIMDTIRKAESYIKNNSWSQIYCLAGICDLTFKHRPTRIVSIRDSNSSHLVRDYCNTLLEAHSTVMQMSPLEDKPKCIFCPVTGLNFSVYNKRHHSVDYDNQATLNETIAKLNSQIVEFNNLHNNQTPWTNRTVHRRHRQSFTNHYDKLASDGCHLSLPLRQHWAEALHEAVVKNA